MPVEGEGRRCLACQRHIVDFRRKTNAEIASIHAHSEAPVCGLYTKKQLRQRGPARRRESHTAHALSRYLPWVFGAWLTAAPAATGTPQSAEKVVQEAVPQPAESQEKTAPGLDAEDNQVTNRGSQAADTLVVWGTVRDSEKGEPLPGVNVVLKGTTHGIATDLDGTYHLEIPDEYVAEGDSAEFTLIFSFVGYFRQPISVVGRFERRRLDVVLKEDGRPLPVIAFGVKRSPWWKRAWWEARYIFQRAFSW